MCGRYVIEDFQELSETLRQIPFQIDYNPKPNWNVAPTQVMPVLLERHDDLIVEPMKWGLIPPWTKPGERPKVAPINARTETVAEKSMFKGLIRNRRCVVPASGFYEWKRTGGPKTPYYIQMANKEMMLFAGLYDLRDDHESEAIGSYTILTGRPNHIMAEIHDRMPTILHPDDVKRWLDPELDTVDAVEDLFAPVKDQEITMVEVSTKVNSVKNNTPDNIEPVRQTGKLL